MGIKHFLNLSQQIDSHFSSHFIHIFWFLFATPHCRFILLFFMALTPECCVTILIICLNHQYKSNYFQLGSFQMLYNGIKLYSNSFYSSYFFLSFVEFKCTKPKILFFPIENGNYTTE